MFVVMGIVILGTILGYVLLFSDYAITDKFIKEIQDPESFMSSCVESNLNSIVNNLLENNLYSSPVEDNYFKYNNDGVPERIPFLCTVGEFNAPCINQEPVLMLRLKTNFESEIFPRIDSCWVKMVASFERQGDTIFGDLLNKTLLTGKEVLEIKISNSLIIKSGDNTQSYSEFNIETNTRIFKLAALAQKIVNFESTLCEFNIVAEMGMYPEIFIKRFRSGDQTKMYTLEDRATEESIKFAVRTCVIPAGI